MCGLIDMIETDSGTGGWVCRWTVLAYYRGCRLGQKAYVLLFIALAHIPGSNDLLPCGILNYAAREFSR